MLKLPAADNTKKYAVVIVYGFVFMAAAAFGGWYLGRSTAAKNDGTWRMSVVKGTSEQIPARRLLPYEPGKLYGLPQPQDPQHIMHILQQKGEAYRRALAAKAARERTRQLLAPDRSNVDCAHMKCIALTYDDGPHKRLDSKLLDILHQRKAAATFFVVGNKVEGDESLLKRMVQEKNEVANHSWSHANLKLLTGEQIVQQVELTNKAIFEATGQHPRLMRPPYAKHDARVVEQIGMPIALWNIDPEDWRAPSTTAIYEHVIAHTKPGSVVVMHDIKEKTIAAAPLIIDELQRQGYVLVTMSELFGITGANAGQFSGQILRGR